MSLVKKLSIILMLYVVNYFFLVNMLHASRGKWYWNLIDFFGLINFLILTTVFFISGLWLEKTLRGYPADLANKFKKETNDK